MQETGSNNSSISIQVSLSGYSFSVAEGGQRRCSGWLGADRIFTTPEFQRRYEQVGISLFTPKFVLVPKSFFNPQEAAAALSDVVKLREEDQVEYVEEPAFGAVLVFSNSIGESLSRTVAATVMDTSGNPARILPEIHFVLADLPRCPEYNKIVCSWRDGYLYMAIAQGKSLRLCNVFTAADFTTAEYFIFLAMKNLQLNPEVSTICFRTALDPDQEMSLYRYFKAVEAL